MTNKRDKIEMICQKASEIGIHEIIIRTSKRSMIQIISDNKIQRLQTIILEASEQSRNGHIPIIKVIKKIQDLPKSLVAFQD
jgi:16S rRNA (uracil1498-N3)-methyltransferase